MSDTTHIQSSGRLSGRGRGILAAYGVWIAAAVVLLVLPHVFSSGLALSTMCLMGISVIFALSYNMLLGQTGMLSFGHAVFFGLGGFLTAHMVNAARGADAPLPLFVFPLVGAATGLVFGIVFGSVATRRAGTAFAMITLGIGELVASSSHILHGVFGGEEGVTINRTKLLHLFGWSFGPQIQVYYLIAAWCLVAAILMYALTRTPFGRICNAVRDNPERVRFTGYNTTMVRFMAYSLSGLFAGVAGGLAAVNFEIMNFSQMGAAQSGSVILMTYIGGVGNFAGPIIGAILVIYLQVMLSDVTGLWQLYFGLLFVLMVLYAPEGIAGLLAKQQPLWRTGQLRRVVPWYALAAVPGVAALVGLSLAIEMSYQLTVNASDGPEMSFGHVTFDADNPLAWAAAVVLFAGGLWLFRRIGRRALDAYGAALANALAGRAAS